MDSFRVRPISLAIFGLAWVREVPSSNDLSTTALQQRPATRLLSVNRLKVQVQWRMGRAHIVEGNGNGRRKVLLSKPVTISAALALHLSHYVRCLINCIHTLLAARRNTVLLISQRMSDF